MERPLIVGDPASMRTITQQALRGTNRTVEAVNDAASGVEIFRGPHCNHSTEAATVLMVETEGVEGMHKDGRESSASGYAAKTCTHGSVHMAVESHLG